MMKRVIMATYVSAASILLLKGGVVSALAFTNKRPINAKDHGTSSEETSHHKYLIHEGRSKDMILRAPSIAGLQLIENWNDQATKDLARATQQLVDANPILRGRLSTDTAKRLWIETKDDNTNPTSFMRTLPTPPNAPDFAQITDPQQRLEVLQKQIVPLFDPCELTATQIARNLPLFSVTLLRLPSNYVVYAVSVSHAVGDGVTFFQLVKQLSLFMSGLSVEHPIDWNCPAKSTHEFTPPSSTPRDADVAYGIPMLMGVLKNFPFLPFRQQDLLLLSKSQVTAKKRALRAEHNTTDISSNDVLTAALCEACESSDLFLFTENVRGDEIHSIPLAAGGNFFYEVPVSRATAQQPARLREVVRRHGEYEPNQLPWRPFACGRVGRITSLASIAETVLYEDTTVVCTVPLASFLGQIPLDVAVVFRYDKKHWGILHNFGKFNRKAKLMSELILS